MKHFNSLLFFLCFFTTQAFSQDVTISGKVTNSNDNTPIEGVTVSANTGSKNHALTNAEGFYTLKVSADATQISFSHVGMKSLSEIINGRRIINIKLTSESAELDQVVVTALGIKRESRSLSFSQQNIDVDAMNETKSPNIINSLSGKVAGLQVIPSGFNTGSARVIIRGNNSLTGNNQPLFVVDGMPIDNEAGDGNLDYGNGAADINPDDIESISVLKGPNASALYGQRGANGVILITTKKGAIKFKVGFNSSMMFQRLTEFPDYQNAYGVGTSFYIDNTHSIPVASVNYRSWGSPMLGQPYIALNGELKPYLPHPTNVKDFYTSAHLYTNSVSVEGGNAGTIYRFAYTNYVGTSVVQGFNESGKHSIDLRLQNTFAKWFTLDTKISFIRESVNNRQYSNSNGRNPTNLYTQMARSTDLSELTPYQDPITGMEIGTHRNFSNPYWVINKNPNKDTKDRIIASFSPVITINPWLRFTGRLGADIYWWNGFEFNDIGSVIANNPNGFLRNFNQDQQNFNLEGIFSANKKFNDISLTVNAGASSFSSNYEKREQRINSLLQPGLMNVSNAREYPIVTQLLRRRNSQSIFAAATVGYKNFAFIDVTARNDWSSTLPEANNHYFYPSLGTSLVLSDMFKLTSNFLSFAKIRASIAGAGSDGGGDPYRLDQTYTFNGFFNGAPLASLSNIMNNPDLKSEYTTSYEYGVDLRFLKNRISFSGSRYNSRTTDQIITANVPTSSGYIQRIYNAGEIKNWGYEATLSGRIIQGKNFSWESQVNFSKNNSLVVSLIDSIDRFVLNNNSSYIYVYAQVGKPYAYLRGLGVARDADGHMLIDAGGSLLTKNDDMPFGTASPDWLGSFRNTFTFGKISLSCLLDIKMGGLLYSGSYSSTLTNGIAAETMYARNDYYKHSIIFGESATELTGGAVWDAYYADGTKNTKFSTPQNYEYARPNFAEFVMFDASYVKLREITVGYNFSGKILSRTPIKTARVSLAGRNLAILYRKTPFGIDPEAASTSGNGQGIEKGSLPPNAIYGFNINLTF